MINASVFVLSPDFPSVDNCAIINGPYDKSCMLAKSLGYDGIEIIISDPSSFNKVEVADLLLKQNLCLTAINSGGIEYYFNAALVHRDPKVSALAQDKLCNIIDICGHFGCLTQVGVARGYMCEQLPYRSYKDRLVGVLKEMTSYAKKKDVHMVFEYTNRLEINTINNFGEAVEIVDRVGSDRLGILCDTYHSWLEDDDIYQVIRSGKDYIKHFHLHDSNRGPAGASNGKIDFDMVFDILHANQYDGAVSDGLLTLDYPKEKILESTSFIHNKIAERGLRNGCLTDIAR